ncbi:Fur family transcriptional regulator [Micropruina sp.]|uniref:Fur family transcriptional regulator n=1 Tax=Micropruina sp. TaxID=2737536 RepID=UPI0039E6B90E
MTNTERTPRNTRQRAEVRNAVAGSKTFATSQEIHDRLRHDGSKIGLATVYRTLQTMAAGGEIDTIRTPDGQIAYRTCTPGHHHHLVCRACGRTVEIDLPGLEEATRNIAGEYGFAEIDHEVEFFGLCTSCR